MCRLLGIVGPPVADGAGLPSWEHLVGAPHSLRLQAERGKVPPGDTAGHEDSWGIGWLDAAGRVSLLRETGSALHSAFFVFAAETAGRAAAGSGPPQVILGHLRKASCGAVTSENAHPVRVDPLDGQAGDSLLVTHNGTLKGALLPWAREAGRAAGRSEASSDSDTVVLAGLLAAGAVGAAPEQRFGVLADTIRALLEQAALEGDPTRSYTAINLMVAAPEGLYVLRQFSKNPDYYTLQARPMQQRRGWIVASEPTDNEVGWELLAPGELVFYPAVGGSVRKERVLR